MKRMKWQMWKQYRIVLQLYLCPQLLQFSVHMTCLDWIHLFLQFPGGTEYIYHMWVADIDSEREMETYLYFSCVSLISLLSSSILSAVNLRTITSSMVSTTSPFSPRLRLQGEHTPNLPMNLWMMWIRWLWLPMILAKIIVSSLITQSLWKVIKSFSTYLLLSMHKYKVHILCWLFFFIVYTDQMIWWL